MNIPNNNIKCALNLKLNIRASFWIKTLEVLVSIVNLLKIQHIYIKNFVWRKYYFGEQKLEFFFLAFLDRTNFK